ncbi:hypothetical protein V2J09_012927 [Rumex salicifolius]
MAIESNIKAQFPTTANSFDCCFDNEVYHETKHAYPPGMKKKNRLKIVQGKRLGKDVISLLSNGGKRDYLVRNNGVRVPLLNSIAGKYLLVCCFAIPIASYKYDADLCRNLISAYSQLKAADCNFEMVIVARIASANMVVNDGDDEAAFNRFFDAFPCLAVPFSDSESRDLLCYSLGLATVGPRSSSLLLDPDQLVLQTDADCFNLFGAAAFPFTTNHLDALNRQDGEIKLRLDFIEREMKSSKEAITAPWIPVSLEELLGGCHLLHRTGCIKEEEEEVISVSELSKKKCVGLYLCYNGNFMPKLDDTYKECAAKNREFEVVLVHIPIHSDTTAFIDAVNLHLCEEKITSWWVMPLVDEVYRRLWRLCDHSRKDSLVVLTDDGWGDLKGRFVIEEKGLHTYPFTRKSLLHEYTLHFRSFTVESLLNRLTSHCGNYNGPVPVCVLKNKNVLVCIDDIGGKLYKLVCNWYNHIQKKYPGTRVVLVPYTETNYYPEEGYHPPWLLYLPLEAARSVRNRIYIENDVFPESTLVAFGKDGFLLSREAQYRIHKSSLFDDTLRQELVEMLAKILTMSVSSNQPQRGMRGCR